MVSYIQTYICSVIRNYVDNLSRFKKGLKKYIIRIHNTLYTLYLGIM